MASMGLLGGIAGGAGQYLKASEDERKASLQAIRDKRLAQAGATTEQAQFERDRAAQQEDTASKREYEGGLLAEGRKYQEGRDEAKHAQALELEGMKKKKPEYMTDPETGNLMAVSGAGAVPVTTEREKSYELSEEESFDEGDKAGLLESVGSQGTERVPVKGAIGGKDSRTNDKKRMDELVAMGVDPDAAQQIAYDTKLTIKDGESGQVVVIDERTGKEIGYFQPADPYGQDSKATWVPASEGGAEQPGRGQGESMDDFMSRTLGIK